MYCMSSTLLGADKVLKNMVVAAVEVMTPLFYLDHFVSLVPIDC